MLDKDVISQSQARHDLAVYIWEDFAKMCRCREDLIRVDDGNDRWIADLSDVQSALDDELTRILSGTYYSNSVDCRGDVVAMVYDAICSDVVPHYSHLGGQCDREWYAGLDDDSRQWVDDELGVHSEDFRISTDMT